MKFEITEIKFSNPLTGLPEYRYDCFIDNVIITAEVWIKQKEPYDVYKYFLKLLIRDWKWKYKRKYEKELGENHKNGQEMYNPRTIISEDIQDFDLTLKQAQEFIRLQKMEGDFI